MAKEKNTNKPSFGKRLMGMSDTNMLLSVTIIIFVLMYAAAIIFMGGAFRKPQSLFNILNSNAPLLITACGMSLVMITGGIDISVGGVVGLVTMACAVNLDFQGGNAFTALLIALGIGLAFGIVQGLLVAYLGIQPFIVTLAGMFFARGLTTIIHTNPFNVENEKFIALKDTRIPIPGLGTKNINGVYIPAYIEIGVIIAIVVHFTGTAWVNKLLPPVIIGPTVALIGLSLAGSAMGDIVKASGATGGAASYNLVGLLCGLIAFFTICICTVQNRFKSMKLIPFILGILVGYAVAGIFSAIGYGLNVEYLKIISFQPLIDNFKNISINSFLSVPHVALVEGIKELATGTMSAEMQALGATQITWVGVAEVALAFIPVAFVVYAEHIADHTNLGSIIGRDLLTDPGMSRTLLGDGVGSIAGTFFGICPNTTYGESVGCVAITKNASVSTIFVAALMLIILAFLAPITAFLRTIPSCVMGGVCLTLYGFIAVSGFKMFQKVELSRNRVLFTVSAILIAGIGGLAIKIPYALDGDMEVTKTIQITSIATALILGIVTYNVTGWIEKHNKPEDDEEKTNLDKTVKFTVEEKKEEK